MRLAIVVVTSEILTGSVFIRTLFHYFESIGVFLQIDAAVVAAIVFLEAVLCSGGAHGVLGEDCNNGVAFGTPKNWL